MDLRKLRNHPISEVARFKKTMKSATPYAAIFAIVIAIAALAFALYRFHDSKQIQKEPIKVFKAIEPPNPLGEKEQKKQISSIPSENRDADLSHETLMGRMPVSSEDRSEIDSEFETPAPTTQSTLDAPTVSNIEAAKQKEEGEARKAEIAKLNAEADQVLADGEAILSQARATMHRAAPLLVSHLNTLSREEQLNFLNQVRAQMYSQSPPEVQGFMDDDPELAGKAWQALLDLLYDHGYQPK